MFKVGDKVRRKNHKKQAKKKNNHEIVEIVRFYHSSGLDMVEFKKGTESRFMSVKGLEFYEKV